MAQPRRLLVPQSMAIQSFGEPPADEMEQDEQAMLAEAAQAAEALGAEADEPTTSTLDVGEILIGDAEKS